ncbi:MAG TPA: DUF503 domain-containing protein [Ktedonobacterales bacterium]|nr:DUF503 domain-containing protein [Ktedonobacterales bacterium]
MYIGSAVVTLRLFDSSSLKDKRQVARSLLSRLRNQFGVATAEVDTLESWNLLTIGLAYVSNDHTHATEVIDHAVRFIEATRPDVEITNSQVETLTVGD